MPHGPSPASIHTAELTRGGGPGRRAASGQGCREEVPAGDGGGWGGGESRSEGSEQGAAALRAGGSGLRGKRGRSWGSKVPGRTGS